MEIVLSVVSTLSIECLVRKYKAESAKPLGVHIKAFDWGAGFGVQSRSCFSTTTALLTGMGMTQKTDVGLNWRV